MGRHARPWTRKDRDGWWSKVEGRPVRLGDTEREAWAELHRLEAHKGSAVSPGARLTVPELVDLWLDARLGQVRPATWRNGQKFGQSLARHCKRLRARDLRPLHITAWLAAHPTWRGGRGLAVQVAKQVTRWARREGWLDVDPLADMRGIAIEPRKPAAQGDAERIEGGFRCEAARTVCRFMLATGCRPGEARTLEASRIDLNARRAIVTGKRGRRAILLPESLLEPLRVLTLQITQGPIFRNSRGDAWSEGALAGQFRRARRRAGCGESMVAYSCRGIFASRAHRAGADGVAIATLLGHKDVSKLKVLITHYLQADESKLREAVEGAQSGH